MLMRDRLCALHRHTGTNIQGPSQFVYRLGFVRHRSWQILLIPLWTVSIIHLDVTDLCDQRPKAESGYWQGFGVSTLIARI